MVQSLEQAQSRLEVGFRPRKLLRNQVFQGMHSIGPLKLISYHYQDCTDADTSRRFFQKCHVTCDLGVSVVMDLFSEDSWYVVFVEVNR